MPFYDNEYKTLEQLEEDYNNGFAPKLFSFAGVLLRWCEPEEEWPIVHVSLLHFILKWLSINSLFSTKLKPIWELKNY